MRHQIVSALLCFMLIGKTVSVLPGNEIRVTYVDSLSAWWGAEAVAAGIAMPGFAKPHLYTVINLAFLLHYGAADAAMVWEKPFSFIDSGSNPFGKSEQEVRQAWLKRYHDNGVKIMVSAFGATEFPTSAGYDPDSYCTTLGQYVVQHNLDGIDLDWEDNDAMNRGTGEDWVIRCTRAIRKVMPKGQYILTHAPQGPYFAGTSIYKNGGYLKIHQEVGDLIDWYNIQYYNQGDTTYDSYESLFITANGYFKNTAVKELMNSGIPKEKIVIGKPVTPADASNTGWISAIDFHNWSQRAANEIGWQTGIMDWQYKSDASGAYVHTYLHGTATE